MGLENVRKDILEKTEKRMEEASKKEELSKVAKNSLKMAEAFYERKNYTSAYFMYFKALKEYSLLYLNKKMGNIDLLEQDALEFIGKKEMFGINQKAVDELVKLHELIVARKELSKENCDKIIRIVNKIKKEV